MEGNKKKGMNGNALLGDLNLCATSKEVHLNTEKQSKKIWIVSTEFISSVEFQSHPSFG